MYVYIYVCGRSGRSEGSREVEREGEREGKTERSAGGSGREIGSSHLLLNTLGACNDQD